MAESLKEALRRRDTDFLKEQYISNRGDYTEEALDIISDILKERGISSEEIEGLEGENDSRENRDGSGDLVPFDNCFRYGDISTVYTIIGHNDISFTIKPAEEDSRKEDPQKRYFLYVSPGSVDRAGEIIDLHFETVDGEYINKHKSLTERLKGFNFHEAALYSADMKDRVELDLSEDERAGLVKYLERIIKESEEIERESGSYLFYYDNFGDLLDYLREGGKEFYVSDFLAVIEVLKAYCHEEDFPEALEPVAEGLLDVFIKS